MNLLRALICAAALFCGVLPASANWLYTPGAGPSAFVSFNSGTTPPGTSLCAAANTDCLANVPINLAGNPLFVTGNAGLVTGTGGAFPVTQTTSPWVVSNGGTFATQSAITAASASIASGAYAVGSIASGADVTEGTTAETTVYAGSGGCTVVACLKGLYAAIITGAGPTGSAVPTSAVYIGGIATSTEPTAATAGNLVGAFFDLSGKTVTSPYANRANMTRCAGSTTGSGAVTCTTGGMVATAGVKNYITGAQCFRTDAGTSTAFVTLNDTVASTIVLPVGGGSNPPLTIPFVTAANTAVTWTPSTALTTVFCNFQGYSGY